jgi:hypothetical protein
MAIVATNDLSLGHLVSFTVRNVGTLVSDEVVLLFLVEHPSDPNDAHDPSQESTAVLLPPPPKKRLVRFLRLHSVAPAETATVQFTLGAADFHQHGRRGHKFLVEAGVADGPGSPSPADPDDSAPAHSSSPLDLMPGRMRSTAEK